MLCHQFFFSRPCSTSGFIHIVPQIPADSVLGKMLRVCVVLLNVFLISADSFGDNVPMPYQNELLRSKRFPQSRKQEYVTTTARAIPDGIFTTQSYYNTIKPTPQSKRQENVTTTTRAIPDGIFTTQSYYRTIKPAMNPNVSSKNGVVSLTDWINSLEVKLDDTVNRVRHEWHTKNRQVEWENRATKNEVERLKKELERMQDQQRHSRNSFDYTALENRIDNLTTLVKVMLSNMRILSTDIGSIKKNLTGLATQTELMAQSNTDLLTKQLFNHGLLELRQKYHNHQHRSHEKSADKAFPRHCKDLQDDSRSTGIYRIKPENAPNPFMVFCDMESRDGGWAVIQNRFDGSQDFVHNWPEYKNGFGNLGGEFWLGLDNLFYLTGHEVNELLIELEDFNGVSAYARYAAFSLGSELEGYALKVLGGYSGNAGDSLIYHAGNRFSTKDMDYDAWPEGSCALSHGGGWWYRSCDTSNLNGRYLHGKLPEQFIYQGMYWGDFGGPLYSLRKAKILVRPRDENSPPMFDNSISNSTFEDS